MERARKGGTAAFGFLAITGFINALGIGLVIPVLPALLMDLTGEGVADAALWGGLATFVYAVMQFVFSPIIGGLSDRYGRRPVLLVSLLAFAIDNVILGLASSLWMFFVARTLAGIFAATFATANAYVADVTPAEQRGVRFAILGASFGAGFIFGPALGGLLGDIDPRLPFFAAAAFAFANTLYGYFVIPESLPAEKRRPFSWARSNPLGTLVTLFRTPGVGRLLPVFFLATLSTWVYVTVWSYVAIAKFGWSEGQIGWSVAYYGVISFVAQAVIVQKVLPRIGVQRALLIALVVEAISLTGIGFAQSGVMLYAMITLALISTMQEPALRQELSSRVPADAQGELQGGLAALAGIAIVLAPLTYNSLFNAFSREGAPIVFPGAPFLAAAAMSLIAAVVYLRFRPPPLQADEKPGA
ncbi:MAG: MFS transporter [Pseudomonadota bacterium]